MDFDWAGKAGQVRYPMMINLEAKWAKGVEGGELIMKEHDRFQLEGVEEKDRIGGDCDSCCYIMNGV